MFREQEQRETRRERDGKGKKKVKRKEGMKQRCNDGKRLTITTALSDWG